MGLLTLLLLFCTPAFAGQPSSANPENFRLIDSAGHVQSLEDASSPGTVVLMGIDPACPWSRRLAGWADASVKRNGDGATRLLFLAPGDGAAARAAAEAMRKGATGFPVLMDYASAILREAGLRESGDFLVLDPQLRKVRARGRAFGEELGAALGPGSSGTLARLFRDLRAWLAPLPAAAAPESSCSLEVSLPRVSLTPAVGAAFTRACNHCHSRYSSIDYFHGYADLRNWHAMNLRVLRTLQMPPGGVDYETPQCHLALSDGSAEDLKAVRNWIEAGEPRGEADEIARQRSVFLRAWHSMVAKAPRPDLIWEMKGTDHVEPAGGNRYGMVTLAGPLPEDLHVTAFDLRHNMRVTHHAALLISSVPFEKRVEKYARGAVSERDSDTYIVPLLSWGRTETDGTYRRTAPGTYYLLPKGKYIGLLQHYESDGRAEENRSRLAVYLAPPGERGEPLHVVNLEHTKFTLSPGEKSFELRKTWKAEHDVSLSCVMTHGHYRFVASSIEIVLPGQKPRSECNMPLRRAAYNPGLCLQTYRLPAGSEIRATLTYDNSLGNAANPDARAPVPNGGMSYTEEMDLVRIVYADGFVPGAVDFP